MIPVLEVARAEDRRRVENLLDRLRLDVRSLLVAGGELHAKAEAVRGMLADVATRGDAAVIDLVRRFDDPSFEAARLRVTRDEMRAAAQRVSGDRIAALRTAIAQVRAYQQRIMPADVAYEARPGVTLGLRHTPIDAVGLYVPGGRASYPSSLIMLAVPAQVAGVRRIVVTSPAGAFGDNDLVYAAADELGIDEFYRVGGAAAVGALACGTGTIARVDKIFGPGNSYVQLAKRLVSGAVGVDGFFGPSEILTIADDSCVPAFVAADLLAQAEHDPGRCILLTTSRAVAADVGREVEAQLGALGRSDAIARALDADSAVVVCASDDEIAEFANRFAAEHVSLQVRDADAWLARVRHAGAIFVGPHSPVAAGDYVAGPSHCLPTNTTARFGGGASVFEFLKRTGTARYDRDGLRADAGAIVTLSKAEGLDAHAASVLRRVEER